MNHEQMRGMRWLITGGTGSFGTYATRYVLDNYDPENITIFSRDEYKQMAVVDDGHVRKIIGDVRDYNAVYDAISDHDFVIHAAALKHVSTGESHPWESIHTNVIGTKNVIDACDKWGALMVLLSTDKAVEPINTYGATKMLAEKLTLNAGQSVVRYGNVIGSRGSVFEKFREQAKTGQFTITDERCTRFFVTMKYAVELAIHALSIDESCLLVSDAKTVHIADLPRLFYHNPSIECTGLTKGEKLHETLMTEYEDRYMDAGLISHNRYYYRLDAEENVAFRGESYRSDGVIRYEFDELRAIFEEYDI